MANEVCDQRLSKCCSRFQLTVAQFARRLQARSADRDSYSQDSLPRSRSRQHGADHEQREGTGPLRTNFLARALSCSESCFYLPVRGRHETQQARARARISKRKDRLMHSGILFRHGLRRRKHQKCLLWTHRHPKPVALSL